MPVGFNSAARNLFLLGSSGVDLVTNFFKTIDQSATTDGVYLPDEIRYNFVDQKYLLSGTASDSQSKKFGWFEKRNDQGAADWNVTVQSTQTGVNTTLKAMEIDNNNNLIVVGKTGTVPWIAKYSNGGVVSWQSSTNTADLEYTGIAIDSNNNYYACGNTPYLTSGAQAFIEKFDTSGNPGWGKSAYMLGRDVILNKIAANDRGEVVAVGSIEDDSSYKGYIVKLDATTGEVLWDRTLNSFITSNPGYYVDVYCEDVYIDDNDQIYVVGRIADLGSNQRSFIIKYTAEGNIIWQKQTPGSELINYFQVKSDTETEQTVVFGRYYDDTANDWRGILTKYSKNGDVVWRRELYSTWVSNSFGISDGLTGHGGGINLDADPSFYYVLFYDQPIIEVIQYPERYTFGKVSTSGNGLGDFEYLDGAGETISYKILNISDEIGKLYDGSVRQDTSDLITYPFSANKLVFDDLATQISNKKVQIDEPNTFQYGATTTPTIDYPKISPDAIVYDNNLLLNYDFKNKATYNLSPKKFLIPETTDPFKDSSSLGVSSPILAVGENRIAITNGNRTIHVYTMNGILERSIYLPDLYSGLKTVPDLQKGYIADLAIGEGLIVVGYRVPNNNTLTGVAYSISLSTGQSNSTMSPSDYSADKRFGESVAIGNGKIAVGAVGDGIAAGAVYVYNTNGTGEVKVTASDRYQFDYFGSTVEIKDNKLYVGAYNDDSSGTTTSRNGSIYVYNLDGTGQVKISVTTVQQLKFGTSIAVGNGKIAVGAPGVQIGGGGYDKGAVYVYNTDGSGQTQVIASDNTDYTRFGTTVAIQNSTLIVGSSATVNGQGSKGALYFSNLDGTNQTKLNSPDLTKSLFSYALGTDSKYVVSTFGTIGTNEFFIYDTSVNNLSSNSYTGTITEATFNSAGYFVFDGTNDYIEHATGSFPITGNAAISLEGWFYFTGTNGAGDYKTFFAYGNGPSAGDTIAIGLFDNFRLSASFNGGLNVQTAQNVFPTNIWKHVLVTKSPGAINTTTKIYMNGVEQTITSAPTNSPSFSSRVIRLGRWTNESAGYYYQGRIGEVRIYNKSLSAAEVSKNFNATRGKYGV